MSTYHRLTLIGLYNHDHNIFEMLSLPAAYDRDTFIETVLFDQGEKCVAYPDADFFRYSVGIWSRKWAESLARIARALTEEYDPLHNYDRYEEWTEKESGDYKNEQRKGGSDVLSTGGTVTTDTDGTITTDTDGTVTKDTDGTVTTDTDGTVTKDTDGTVTKDTDGTVTTDTDGTVTKENGGTVTTKETGTSTEQTSNMITERTVSAFNDAGYQPDTKDTVNGTVTRTPNTTQIVTPDTTETTTTDMTDVATTDATETETTDMTDVTTTDATETATTDMTDVTTTDATETATTDMTDVTTYDTTNTTQYGGTENGSGNDRRERKHTAHLFGNIGVTTSQKMAEDEINLRQNYNMYEIAAQLFAEDLLLMLY